MHNQFMLAALTQAWFGRGICAPNPSVGAVVVLDNKIIAADWHRGVGTLHAEQRVFLQLGGQAKGATLYVTLEPCTHWGRTPPCVNAIVEAGIASVVYGYKDPNPVVAANNSERFLQQKGIDVIYYPMPEISQFYESYGHWTETGKPFVTAKIAQTFDGRIAGPHGQRLQLSNDACSEFTHTHRLYADVILSTARTVINDNPLFSARIKGQEVKKSVAILDSQLQIPREMRVFTAADRCFIFHHNRLQVHNPMEQCSYFPVKEDAEGFLDLESILLQLGELGFHDVWIEAGGRLFSRIHQQNLCQRTYLYLVPGFLGEEAPTAFHGPNFFNQQNYAISWQQADNNVIACLDWKEKQCLPA